MAVDWKMVSDSLAMTWFPWQALQGIKYDEKGVDQAMVKTTDLAIKAGVEIEGLLGHAHELGAWLKAKLWWQDCNMQTLHYYTKCAPRQESLLFLKLVRLRLQKRSRQVATDNRTNGFSSAETQTTISTKTIFLGHSELYSEKGGLYDN